MPAHDETTVTVMNNNTGEIMDFTVKTETSESRWTTDAIKAAKEEWKEQEEHLTIKSWTHGNPKKHQNAAYRAKAEMQQNKSSPKETSRFIDLSPTWREAAQIIAAALENGTSTGRDAARAELFRMAELLDAINSATKSTDAQNEAAKP